MKTHRFYLTAGIEPAPFASASQLRTRPPYDRGISTSKDRHSIS